MPVRTNEYGRRWVEMDFLAPATPEQLWRVMATAPGYRCWFARTEIEEKVGGMLRFQFGPGMESTGQVTLWEPPYNFGYVERHWLEGAPPVGTEITIAPRPDGQSLLRMTHTLFAQSAQWDMHLESFENGWPGFFDILRRYLTHFEGRDGASFMAMVPALGDRQAGWKTFTESLGLAGADLGERRNISQPQNLSGVVEKVLQDEKVQMILLRLDAPAPGLALFSQFAMGPARHLGMHLYFYGEDAQSRIAQSETLWQGWLGETFTQKES